MRDGITVPAPFCLFSIVLNAILLPIIPFQQMSDECYDKMFIPNIIDCLISVYSDFLK